MPPFKFFLLIFITAFLTLNSKGQITQDRWDITGDYIWDSGHVLQMENNKFRFGTIIKSFTLRQMKEDLNRLLEEYRTLDSLSNIKSETESVERLKRLSAEISEKKLIEQAILKKIATIEYSEKDSIPVLFLERKPNGTYNVSVLSEINGISSIMTNDDVSQFLQNITEYTVKQDFYNVSYLLKRKSNQQKFGYGFLVAGSSLLLFNSLASNDFQLKNPERVRAINIAGLSSILTGSLVLFSAEIKFSKALIDIELRANVLRLNF